MLPFPLIVLSHRVTTKVFCRSLRSPPVFSWTSQWFTRRRTDNLCHFLDISVCHAKYFLTLFSPPLTIPSSGLHPQISLSRRRAEKEEEETHPMREGAVCGLLPEDHLPLLPSPSHRRLWRTSTPRCLLAVFPLPRPLLPCQ